MNCKWCGADCSFIAATEGMCLSCGDRIQSAGWAWTLKTLAEGAKQVEELRVKLLACHIALAEVARMAEHAEDAAVLSEIEGFARKALKEQTP